MTDEFTKFFDRAQKFYGALAENNTRDWFADHKDEWKRDIEGPAKLLGDIMAEEVSRISGTGHTGKLFRIHRDVRFSKDKSPYKTNLALLWAPVETHPLAPSFYFGLYPDRSFVGCGMPTLSKEPLATFRQLVDRNGDALEAAIEASGTTLTHFDNPPLKRVPKPYDPGHPHAELLKRKGLVMGAPLPDDWRKDGLITALTSRFEALLPVRSALLSG